MLTCIQDFLEYLTLERHLAKQSIVSYRYDLVAFREFLAEMGRDEVTGITRDDIYAFLADQQLHGIKEKSLARRLSAIKSFFRFLALDHVIPHDITEVMTTPQVPQHIPEYLTEDEATALVNAYQGDTPMELRNRAVVELLYATGIRVSECCDLRLASVNFTEGVMRVIGKGSKERVVPFGRPAALALEMYLQKGRPELDPLHRQPYVFLGKRGGRLNRRTAWDIVEQGGVIAGITKKLHPHLLRHSCATHLLAHGADLRVIQELLGHASIDTTQLYTHADTSRLQQTFLKFHPRATTGRPPPDV
ncbi:MAG: site-specific tyrosine recombinase XerD [Victivallales bacterium]|nr:site-specific tyrosine recombinase XerD [Victivallales bacterium]